MPTKRAVTRILVLTALAVVVLAGAAPALEVGQKAPEFALNGPDGKPVKLSDLTAKSPVYRYAKRAYFIIDKTGTVKYLKVMDSPLNILEPAEVLAAVKAANP